MGVLDITALFVSGSEATKWVNDGVTVWEKFVPTADLFRLVFTDGSEQSYSYADFPSEENEFFGGELTRWYADEMFCVHVIGAQGIKEVHVLNDGILNEFKFQDCDDLLLVDASGCTNLINLWVNDNLDLAAVDASGCSNLYEISAASCNISSVDVSGCTSLDGFCIDNNPLSTIDISDCVSLQQFNAGECRFSEIDISAMVDSGAGNFDLLLFPQRSGTQLTKLTVGGMSGHYTLGGDPWAGSTYTCTVYRPTGSTVTFSADSIDFVYADEEGGATRYYIDVPWEFWVADDNPWLWVSLQNSLGLEIAASYGDVTLGYNEFEIEIWNSGTVVSYEMYSDWDGVDGILPVPVTFSPIGSAKLCCNVVEASSIGYGGYGNGWMILPGNIWIEIGD